LSIVDFCVNFHFEDNIANREYIEENEPRENKWNQISNTINDHLNQEAVFLKDFDEEE